MNFGPGAASMPDGTIMVPTDDPDGPAFLRGDAARDYLATQAGAPPSAAPPSVDVMSSPGPLASEGPAMTPAPPPPPASPLPAKPPDFFQRGQNAIDEFKAGLRHAYKDPNDLKREAEAKAEAEDKQYKSALSGKPAAPGVAPPFLARPGDVGGGPQARAAGGIFIDDKKKEDQGPAINPLQMIGMGGATTTTKVGQNQYSKAEIAQQQGADADRAKAEEGLLDVQGKKAGELGSLYTQTIGDLKASQERQAAIEAERRRVMGERQAKLDQLSREAAAEKIDPKHFWGDKDTAYKLESALFQGLSGFGASLNGGPAYAVDKMKQNIDNDIHAQEANLKNKRDTIQAETNLLGQLRQEYGDRQAAETGVRIAMLGMVEQKVNEIGARNLPAEQRAQWKILQAKIQSERIDNIQKLNRYTMSTSNQTKYAPAGLLMGKGGSEDAWTAPEYNAKHPARVLLHTLENDAPLMGLERTSGGQWKIGAPELWKAAAAVGTDAYNAREHLIHAVGAEIVKNRFPTGATETEFENEKKYLRTLSPQQLALELNSAESTANMALGTKFAHSSRQVAGGTGANEE